ncbi:MAG: hypothetical protein WC911_01680 [Thermoleophilia bacterium]
MLDLALIASSIALLLFTAYLIAKVRPVDPKAAIKREFAALRKETSNPFSLAAIDEAEREALEKAGCTRERVESRH